MRALLTAALAAVAALSLGQTDVSDAALVRRLPGFRNASARVNGVRIHYVVGGQGEPLVLLPGWPETWWQYHKIMPTLAKRFRVIVPDLRGMGSSSRPAGGYDKKTMAKDVYGLVRHLGYERVGMAGHDIGAMVAFAYAANYPQATRRLAILDVPHPDEWWMKMPMLPEVGKFGAKIDAAHPGYPWWFAFHQVKGLPERILKGRMDAYQDFLIDYLARDARAVGAFDRRVYHAAYASPAAIRAGDAWYQAFSQDVLDAKRYPKLDLPILGLGSTGYDWLKASLAPKGADVTIVRVPNSGHFMAEEQPAFTAAQLARFFGAR